MRPVSLTHLTAIAVVTGLLAALVNTVAVGSGHSPALITPYLCVVFLGIAVILWVLGRGVRRMRDHQRTWMTPILAMRTAVLARSAALMGSAAVGVMTGILLSVLPRLQAPAMGASALGSSLSLVSSLLMVVVAVVVERWCVIDSGGDDTPPDPSDLGAEGSPA